MSFQKTVYSCFIKIKSISQRFSNFNFTAFIKKSKMEATDLVPPHTVRNMTVLDRNAFVKLVSVPSLIIHQKHLQKVLKKKTKKYILKFRKLNSVMISSESEELRFLLLDPTLISSPSDIKTKMNIDIAEIDGKFTMTEVTLNYENWKAEQILRAVLPEDSDGSSSFSIIGHILHLNLREHLIPYKKLIAEVYLDKNPKISLVVNKTNIIDNTDDTFRTFAIERLAGVTDSTLTTVKENNCSFTFDFSKVYWNPRLSTEHERIINKLKRGDVLFDVMAGVGPFAIPAAKKKCAVFANDLNPSSYEALVENCKNNKVNNQVECFNLDGNEFIRTVFKNKYREIIKNTEIGTVHVTMNLPSLAIEFLPTFIGLFSSDILNIHHNQDYEALNLPVVHVYLFSFNETREYAVHSVASKLGYCQKEMFAEKVKMIEAQMIADSIRPEFWDEVLEVVNVRRVAPAKVMFRVSFRLPQQVLIREMSENSTECHYSKRLKV